MARNAWETMDAGGVSARRGVGFWGWVLRFLAVAGLTLAAGFYWPLYRAHEELTTQYAALERSAETLDREIGVMKTELGATKAKRDELEARRGMDQSRERAWRELTEQIKTDLTSKLGRFAEKGTVQMAAYKSAVVIRFPSAVSQSGAHPEVGAEARLALCALSSAVVARGAVDLRVVARDADGDADKTRGPWDLAAERSATMARALVEKCKYPAEHVEATVRSRAARPALQMDGGDVKTAVDVEIDPTAGAALTAL